MADRLHAALAVLPERLGWHVALSACALTLGLAIALPLGIAAARQPRLKWIALATAGLVQTIPSLALLALFYPLLLLLSRDLTQLRHLRAVGQLLLLIGLQRRLHPELFAALVERLLPQVVVELVVVVVRLDLRPSNRRAVAGLIARHPVLQRRLLDAPVVILIELVLLLG